VTLKVHDNSSAMLGVFYLEIIYISGTGCTHCCAIMQRTASSHKPHRLNNLFFYLKTEIELVPGMSYTICHQTMKNVQRRHM
jgi:hypothetical protein